MLYRLSALAFSIFAFWIIGKYSTALRNYLATRRLLFFIADLISSFRAEHTRNFGEPHIHVCLIMSTIQVIVVKKCTAKDHSAQLVGIVKALGNPPFGLLHRLSALAFSIFVLWIIG
ncbi:hypothetical protein H5410_026855 [Solanum commersonii]|uniref:Uncharacterized protein n=1 Tax=Solanum commersonii TaxID=4109 RepID=A0A9J5YXC9_SOLCO|nr:hypothetical protein H5410_026855 [Solanum commersonii]